MFVVTAKTSASNGACAHAWQTAAEYSKPEKLSGCFVPGPACLRVPVLAEVWNKKRAECPILIPVAGIRCTLNHSESMPERAQTELS